MSASYRVTFHYMSDDSRMVWSTERFTSLSYALNANDVTEAVVRFAQNDAPPPEIDMRGIAMRIWRRPDTRMGYELEGGTEWIVGRITKIETPEGFTYEVAAQHPNVILRKRIVAYKADTLQADKIERPPGDVSNWDTPARLIAAYYRENVSQPIIDIVEAGQGEFTASATLYYQGLTRNTRVHLHDGSLLYLNDDAATKDAPDVEPMTGYEELHASPAGSERAVTIQATPLMGDVPIRTFITEDTGGWGKTDYPAVNWLVRTWAAASTLNGGSTFLKVRFFKRATNGVEVPLFDMTKELDSVVPKMYDIFGAQEAFSIDPTDRLVLKVYVYVVADPTADRPRTLPSTVEEPETFGQVTESSASYQNLLNVMQDLAQQRATNGDRTYFQVVTFGGQTRFQIRKNMLGIDRSGSVFFGFAYGNISEVTVTKDYDKEVNVIYAGGEGSGIQQLVTRVRRASASANPFFWSEEFETFGDIEAEKIALLQNEAWRHLDTMRARRIVRARVINAGAYLYGRDYGHGDFVTLATDDSLFTCHVFAVNVTFDGTNETVDVYLDAQDNL